MSDGPVMYGTSLGLDQHGTSPGLGRYGGACRAGRTILEGCVARRDVVVTDHGRHVKKKWSSSVRPVKAARS